MRDIRRPDWAEPTVDRLTTTRVSESGAPIFPTIMDLLIFAAGVGFRRGKRMPVPSTGKAVPYRIFENNQKEGHIFLLALAERKDPSALLEENADEAARVFEEYAAGGLDEITGWLNTNALDSGGVQSLITAIQSELPPLEPRISNPVPI